MANNIDRQYKELLEHILHFGVEKKDRTGTGTKSIFGWQIRHRMSEGFPLLTTKKMAFKTMVTELLWFLRGDTNIKYLVDNDCHIWDGDAYKRYWFNWRPIKEDSGEDLTPYTKDEFINRIKTDDEFAKKWGELGPLYGHQWRSWDKFEYTQNSPHSTAYGNVYKVDQIQNLINELKTNPDSRRLMVSAWNVGKLDQMVLPPCHYGFQVYTRELSIEERLDLASKTYGNLFEPTDFIRVDHEEIDKLYPVPKRAISLMWNQRSVDTALGWPINVASYSLLLMMLAKQVNMVPDEVICNLGDCHIYLDHVDGVKEQLTRQPMQLPIVKLSDRIVSDLSEYTLSDITLQNYESHPKIYFPLSN